MTFNIGDRVRYLGHDETTLDWHNSDTNIQVGEERVVEGIHTWSGRNVYNISGDNNNWVYLETQLELVDDEQPEVPAVFDRFLAFRRTREGELRRSLQSPDTGLHLDELREALRDQRQTYWIVPLRYVAIIDENGVLTPTIDNL